MGKFIADLIGFIIGIAILVGCLWLIYHMDFSY